MSADAWERCPKCKSEVDSPSLREDYEIGVDDAGLFYVYFSAHCADCGFKHKFRHEEQLA